MKLLAILMVVGCLGCSSEGDKTLDGFEALKKQMCACTTKECAEDVDDKVGDWMLEVKNVSVSTDPKHAGRWLEIDRALQTCATKFGVGRGAATP